MRTRQKLIVTAGIAAVLVAGSAGIAAFAGTQTDDFSRGTVQKIAPVTTGPTATSGAVDQKFATGTDNSGTDSAQDQAEAAAQAAAAASAAAADPNGATSGPTSVPGAAPSYLDDHGGNRHSGTDDTDGHSGSGSSSGGSGSDEGSSGSDDDSSSSSSTGGSSGSGK
jgi:hypothetical protein